MKISQKKKKEIRKTIIKAAVEVITEKDFRSATMREISTRAGLGTATIYNYFPNKEKILYGYIEDTVATLKESLKNIPDFDTYTLKEKLQSHLEGLLGLYLEDREFVQKAYKLMFDSPLHISNMFMEFIPIDKVYTEPIKDFINEAFEKGDIPELPFMEFLVNLYGDYTGMIVLYWLSDDSPGFSATSELIDMSLDVIIGIMESGILSKSIDIITFLFRRHIAANIGNLHKIFSSKNRLDKFFAIMEPSDEDT